MAITVKLNLPKEENLEEFQDRMCFAIAKTILDTKPQEYIKELKVLLAKEG